MGSVCWSLVACTLLIFILAQEMVPSFITAIKLLLFLSESILPSPLQQDGISISEIRPESGRSIHAPHGVIITQSYSKIRRQGRKGDPDPFAINALQSKLDDDLSKENSIPVSNDFGNDGNSLPTPTLLIIQRK